MTLAEFEAAYAALGENVKTKTVDAFNKGLIKQGAEVSFLRCVVQDKQQYFRTYFQVSLARRPAIAEKMRFIEENFDLLQDWWHTDMLPQFLGNQLSFDFALEKARKYVRSPLPYVRRWGYVLFIPRLVRAPEKIEPLFALFQREEVYHVVMAQAWLLSCLAMCDPDRTWEYLRDCDLGYNIVGRAIQKICDSFVISPEDKARFKALRPEKRE